MNRNDFGGLGYLEVYYPICPRVSPISRACKGVKSAVDSCIKLIRDTADLPHHITVISIVERVKQEIGKNRNFKKRIHELTRNLNKSQQQTPLFHFQGIPLPG
jgi:hypothetical protein